MSREAPGALELVRSFINTAALDGSPDELDSPAALHDWLVGRALLDPDENAGQDELASAIAVREALRALCYANTGGPLDPSAPDVLDAAIERIGLRLRFERSGSAVIAPACCGVSGALGRLLVIVYEAMQEGTWSRLKACRSDDCRWAFYDGSRNHSGAWCSMDGCGNRAKARAFRERHAGA